MANLKTACDSGHLHTEPAELLNPTNPIKSNQTMPSKNKIMSFFSYRGSVVFIGVMGQMSVGRIVGRGNDGGGNDVVPRACYNLLFSYPCSHA